MRISKLVGKIIARIAFYFLLLTVLLLLLVQIAPIQTYLTKQVLHKISEKTNYEVSLESVRIAWLDRADLNDLLILDKQQDTLVFAERIRLNYRISDLLNSEFLSVEDVTSDYIRLKLTKHDSISGLNLSDFLNSLKSDKDKKSKPIYVEEVNLGDFDFSLTDKTAKPKFDRLDLSRLHMEFADFQLSDLSLHGDTIEMEVIEVRGADQNQGLNIEEFETKLKVNNQSLSLIDLSLKTETSQVSDSIKLYFNGLRNLSHFVDSVSFGFYLSNTSISQQDLQLFIGPHNVRSSITFDGVIWGTVGDFNLEQSKIGFGSESFIEGGVSCFGLPDPKKTFALADITDSHVITADIEPYVGKISRNVEKLGKLDFTGSFAGFLNDFVARGDFVTEKGSVHSDINIKIPEDPTDMSYSGNVELKQVDLGAFLEKQELVQTVNLKGHINGSGITQEKANFELNAVSFGSGLYGYVYDTIRADGKFASNFFKGDFSIEDPNCRVKGNANLDFNLDEEIMKVDIDIDSTNLNALKLVVDTLITSGNLSVDITNLNIDQFRGKARIDSAVINANGNEVLVDSVLFTATLLDNKRHFSLNLPGVEAELQGDFRISDALKDLSNLAMDYSSKIQMKNDTSSRNGSNEKYKMDLFAKVDNLSRYLDSLKIPLEIPDGSFLEASFRESKNSNIFIYAQADYIKLGEHILHNPTLEANGSKSLTGGGILTNFILESDDQEWKGIPPTRNLLVEGIWSNENIDFTTSISQEETNTSLRIEAKVQLTKDSIEVSMMPSDMKVFGDEWIFRTNNKITIFPELIQFENFEIHDETESLEIGGFISKKEETDIQVGIKKLNLNKANLFSSKPVEGLFDGDVNIFRSSSEESYQFDGGFLVSGLTLDDFLVGDIKGTSKWNPSTKYIFSRVEVDRENFKEIDLTGYYHPLRNSNQLDFKIEFDQADLRIAQPFVEEYISNLNGLANGTFIINGDPDKPRMTGSCKIDSGRVKVNYLNTLYSFDGNVALKEDAIQFDNFYMLDRKGSQAEISGDIKHSNFKDIITNIKLDATNFEFLNTTALDNSLYYGSANGSGTIDVTGPLNDLVIKASVKTEKDTRFFVPITEGGDISQQEYIAFIDFNDSTALLENQKLKIQGLTLDFDIEVTPDAYCELIFDIKTGDIIRGRGRGNIKLTLDTDGEFHMFGPLEITDGAYNFTVPGFINKEFTVSSGSRITWFGDPYNANIDLNAVYLQRADFLPLTSEIDEDEEQFSDKVGMNVVLNLSGGMLSPAIDFDLQFADKIDATRERSSKISQIVNDEQELKRQVISLLFFKRFSPLSSFTLGGGGNVGNSVSEFFSNQVSYLVSQLDENLEVEVDLASLDRDAFNTFQLRLAYTFLDGRLKVSRGGNFANEQGTNDRLLEDIVGDWSVEYSLTKDGRLRAKVFRTTNQQISANRGIQNFETGISLRFVHSFNEFQELLKSKRKEAIRRRQEEEKEVNTSTAELDTTY